MIFFIKKMLLIFIGHLPRTSCGLPMYRRSGTTMATVGGSASQWPQINRWDRPQLRGHREGFCRGVVVLDVKAHREEEDHWRAENDNVQWFSDPGTETCQPWRDSILDEHRGWRRWYPRWCAPCRSLEFHQHPPIVAGGLCDTDCVVHWEMPTLMVDALFYAT